MGVGVGMAVSMRVWIGGAAGFSTGPTCSLIICEPSARRELGVEINAGAAATSIFAAALQAENRGARKRGNVHRVLSIALLKPTEASVDK